MSDAMGVVNRGGQGVGRQSRRGGGRVRGRRGGRSSVNGRRRVGGLAGGQADRWQGRTSVRVSFNNSVC